MPKIIVPKDYSTTGELAKAVAGVTIGVRQREKEKREEARQKALLGLEDRRVASGEEQVKVSNRQADIAAEQNTLISQQQAREQMLREEQNAQREAGKGASIRQIQHYQERLKMPVDQSETLSLMRFEDVETMRQNLQEQWNEAQRRDSEERQASIRARDERVRSVQLELQAQYQRLADLRATQQSIDKELQTSGAQFLIRAAEECKNTPAGRCTDSEKLYRADRLRANEVDAEMSRRGIESKDVIERSIQDLSNELRTLTGRGQVTKTKSWGDLTPSQRTQMQTRFESLLRGGAKPSQSELDMLRSQGVPVDIWLGTINQQQDAADMLKQRSKGKAPSLFKLPDLGSSIFSGARRNDSTTIRR